MLKKSKYAIKKVVFFPNLHQNGLPMRIAQNENTTCTESSERSCERKLKKFAFFKRFFFQAVKN